MSDNYFIPLKAKLEEIKRELAATPSLAIQLGTGLASLRRAVEIERIIPYSQLTSLQLPNTQSHEPELIIGKIQEIPILVFAGRRHLYEGFSAFEVCCNVICAKLLDCTQMIITNAAGALNSMYAPGDVVCIEDHINLTGANPLINLADGFNHAFFKTHSFTDMSQAYDAELNQRLASAAASANIKLASGIYAGVLGPSLETNAERRMIRQLGADLVGMSTVNEIIMANHLDLKVAALSAVTNEATGELGQAKDEIDAIMHHAELAGQKISRILSQYCS